MSDALEPELDKESLRVLRAIPILYEDSATVWCIAETVESYDLQDLLLTLHGLVHLDYAALTHRKPSRWRRTSKGNRAVSESSGKRAA